MTYHNNENILTLIFYNINQLTFKSVLDLHSNKILYKIMLKLREFTYESLGNKNKLFKGSTKPRNPIAITDNYLITIKEYIVYNYIGEVWDLNNNQRIKTFSPSGWCFSIALLPNANKFATLNFNTIGIWDMNEDIIQTQTINLKKGYRTTHNGQLLILSNGDLACTAENNKGGYIFIFNKDDYKLRNIIEAHSECITCIINLVGNMLATSAGNKIKV
jgi:hypothetical protein